MKKLYIVLFALTIVLISACAGNGTNTPVHTPTSNVGTVTPEIPTLLRNFQFYDVDLGKDIYEIQNGDIINVTGVNYTIRLNMANTENRLVEMWINDILYRSEGFYPYSLSSNNLINDKEIYEKLNLLPGSYNLKVIIFNNNLAVETHSISFSIIQTPTPTPSQPLNLNWDFKDVSTKNFEYFWAGGFKTKTIDVPLGWEHLYVDGLYAHKIQKVDEGLLIYYHDAQGKTTLTYNFEVTNPISVNFNLGYRWEIFGIEYYDPELYEFKVYLNNQLLNQNFYAHDNYKQNNVNFGLDLEAGFYAIRLEFKSIGSGTGHLFLNYLRIE